MFYLFDYENLETALNTDKPSHLTESRGSHGNMTRVFQEYAGNPRFY